MRLRIWVPVISGCRLAVNISSDLLSLVLMYYISSEFYFNVEESHTKTRDIQSRWASEAHDITQIQLVFFLNMHICVHSISFLVSFY